MTDTSKTVFISYRRSVTRYLALSMFKDLRKRGYDVFWDIEGIGSGQFEKIILTQIEAREHFIVLLAHGSLDRCKNHGDWLRREIEYAIEKERNVIPVLVDGFSFRDGKEFLTHDLGTLSDYNALDLYISYFDAAMDRLHDQFLSERASGLVVPAPAETEETVAEIVREAEEELVPTIENLTAEQWYFRGLRKHDAKDLDGAITDFSEAIRINPQYARAYLSRGWAHAEIGNFDASIIDSNDAIRINPRLGWAYINRGHAYHQKGDQGAAFADFDEAIRIAPRIAMAYSNRGEIQFEQGHLPRAMADFQKANSLEPDLNFALAGLAITYHAQGNVAEAKRLWRVLAGMDERYMDADWVKGELNWHEALVEEARKVIARLG